MLTNAFKKAFERTQLREPDIFQYEEVLHTTPFQDVSSLTQTQYVIETRNHSADQFMFLDEAYLMVKFSLQRNDTHAVAAATAIGSLTESAWSLFARVQLDINNSRIDYAENPGKISNVLYKASKSYDWVVDNGPLEFYYPAGFNNQLAVATGIVLAQGATDTNFLVGANKLQPGAGPVRTSVWAKCPLKAVLGFCNIKRVLSGVNVALRLEKQTNYNAILMRSTAAPNVDYETVIEQIQLYVPTIKVSPKLADEFASKIKSQPMIIDWQQLGYQVLNGTTNGSALNLNIFSGQKRPRYLLVAVQEHSQVLTQDGTAANVNGGIFQIGVDGAAATGAVSEVFITVNGQQYPFVKYNGSSSNYLREVIALKRMFGKDKGGDSSSITRLDNFSTYNAIWAFDFSKVDDLFEQQNQSDVIVKLTFNSTTAAAQDFHCVYIADAHNKLEMAGGTLQITSA